VSKIIVRYEEAGFGKTKSNMRSLERQASQMTRRSRSESRQTANEAERATRRTQRTEEEATRRGASAVRRGEEEKRREIRKTERERERNHRNSERRARAERRRARILAGRRLRGNIRGAAVGGLQMAGGAIAGGLVGGLGVARGMQNAFGVRSQMDILGSAVDARQNIVRAASQGGLRDTGQIQQLIERASGIARTEGISPEQLFAGIGTAQERFSMLGTARAADVEQGGTQNMDEFLENMGFFARVARASGSDLQDVVGTAGEFQRQFQLSAEDTRNALAIVSEGALQGSLSLRDFSRRFPAAIAAFQGARGISGLEALREFQAQAQALRAAGVDPRVARTLQQNLLGTLSNRLVQRRLRTRFGVQTTNEEGRVRNVGSLVSDLIEASGEGRRDTSNLGNLIEVFGNQEAARAMLMLMQGDVRAAAGQGGALSLTQREQVDVQSGHQLIGETAALLRDDPSGDIIQQRIDREARLVAASDELLESFGRLSGMLTRLEDQNPYLTAAAPAVGSAVAGAGAVAVLRRMAGSAASAVVPGAAGAAAGGGGIAAGLGGAGTGVGAAGAGAIGGTVAAGLAAGLGIGGVMGELFAYAVEGENETGRQFFTLSDAVSDLGSLWESMTGGPGGVSTIGPIGPQGEPAPPGQQQTEVRLDPESARQIGEAVAGAVQRPGAGRREEGSPTR
jgi:hypothetical protein